MEYIKKNKIFLSLVSVLLLLIAYLGLQLSGFGNDETGRDTPYEEEEGYKVTTLTSFNGTFNEAKQSIELSWHLIQVDKIVEKVEIYQDEEWLIDVSGKRDVELPLSKYDFKTGNNMFTVKATLDDATILEKNVYVYINEVFGFDVKEAVQEDKIIYTVSYYYDTRRSVSAPSANIKGLSAPFSIAYVSNEEKSRSNHYVLMNATYELDYKDVENGVYSVTVYWSFNAYNLEFHTTSHLEIERQV